MPQNIDPANSGELSPVKRALVEIRQLRAELEASRAARREPIAIIGAALRLPGGVTTPERFWQALANGEDLIGTVPPERWEASEYLNADPDHPGTMYDAHGGFLADVDAFDAEFFGINPREAASMDPQQRLLLELAWEALERAAIDPRTLANTPAGVYVGVSGSDYARHSMGDARDIEAYSAVGSALSIAAGRISYFLALRGPSLAVDTACSSSLVAVHLAVESLRRGETNLAMVGGSNLILAPDFNVSFARTRMLSRDGRSKAFDAAADGYVRGEGCCVIVLKRLSDAVRNGDRVLASIAGIAVNQDGRSAGITAPNGPSQEAVIRAALVNAGLEPAQVSYVEAHGTGTPLGDPIEARALGAVYGMARGADQPLRIGSVKTNLGHTEAAAGLAGLIKVILMMQPGHGIAPQLHFNTPNPNIDFERLHLEVPTAMTAWPCGEGPLYAAVSSFGFSGTNAHVLLASGPAAAANSSGPSEREGLLMLSAASAISLRELAERYVPFLEQTTERFENICFTAAVGRTSFAHRLALRAPNTQAAAEMLSQWLRDETVEALATSVIESQEPDNAVIPAGTDAREGDLLGQWQAEYLRGGDLHARILAASANLRRVELPVYPFARTRFWLGLTPEVERTKEREQMWRSAAAEAQRQSLHGPLGWKLDSYPEKWAALDRLTLAHARNVLAGSGVFQSPCSISLDEVMAKGGFLPLYRNLVGRWLRSLAAAKILEQEHGKFSVPAPFKTISPASLEPSWRDAERLLEDEPGTLAYLKQCGSLLGDVLTGRVSALETLFPQGSFELTESLYESGTMARYFNSIAAAAIANVAASIAPRRNARILEIGGGTGGTTHATLPLLPANQVEYWFTDLSELFLARARAKFNAYPFVSYSIFDLDRALEEQGIGGGQFDVILAANVVHAARDLTAALARMRRLLAPGGILVLLETTCHHGWFDMTTGLIEGWQHFEDRERQDHPLLKPEQWQSLLKRSGFSETDVLPAQDSAAAVLGQHVLLARSTEVSPEGRQAKPVLQSLPEWNRQASALRGEIAEANVAAKLAALGLEEREAAMLDFVKNTVRRVFRLDMRAEELSPRDRLSDLGMDSLIALELRAELVKGLGVADGISSTIAFDSGTVGELSHALLHSLKSHAVDGVSVQPAPPKSSPVLPAHRGRQEARPASVTATQLSEMSEEQVEQLLNERLSRR